MIHVARMRMKEDGPIVLLVRVACDLCGHKSGGMTADDGARVVGVEMRLRALVRRRFGWSRATLVRPGDDQPVYADVCPSCRSQVPKRRLRRPWKS